MIHISQIFTSLHYKVLDSFEEMKGKTVIGVFQLSCGVKVFVNEGTILFLTSYDERVEIAVKGLVDIIFPELEEKTGITKDQLL